VKPGRAGRAPPNAREIEQINSNGIGEDNVDDPNIIFVMFLQIDIDDVKSQ
jgi:hypothetical protein